MVAPELFLNSYLLLTLYLVAWGNHLLYNSGGKYCPLSSTLFLLLSIFYLSPFLKMAIVEITRSQPHGN